MAQAAPASVTVYDLEGAAGRLAADALDGADEQVTITLADARRLLAPRALLQARADGGYTLPLRFADLAGMASGGVVDVIPVVAEEAQVRKQQVETGRVRIQKRVVRSEEVVDVPLLREEVQVERVRVERLLDEAEAATPPAPRQEGDTLIIPVLEEVLVVQKRLLVREEIRVTTARYETQHQEAVTLRREEVEITRAEPNAG